MRVAWEKLKPAEIAAKQRAWEERYRTYMNSLPWILLRAKGLGRAKDLCECCKRRPAVQVHHLTYTLLGNEDLADLLAVCMECHRKIHPRRFED
jgi:hypothetical protein